MGTTLSCTIARWKCKLNRSLWHPWFRHLRHNYRGEEIERKEEEKIEPSMCEALALKSTRLSSLSASHMFFDAFCRRGKLQTICLFGFSSSVAQINTSFHIYFYWLVSWGRSQQQSGKVLLHWFHLKSTFFVSGTIVSHYHGSTCKREKQFASVSIRESQIKCRTKRWSRPW